MYEAYYGFDEKPFTLSPDPRYLFLSGTHREVLGHLLYGIEQGEGFMAISGEVGTGKTTLCRTLLDRLGASCEIAFLFNPTLTPTDLIKAINGELGLSTFGDSRPELLDVLNTFLLEQNAAGRRVLVIIDEAQNLPDETLEQLRLLSNLESRTSKLLQIILIGQPELDEKLEARELRQLRQRITVWWRLGPLTSAETKAYVRHRMRVAGATRPIFTDAALATVHRLSRGVPRLVNVLCDRSLLAGYGEGLARVTPRLVREAGRELRLGRASERLSLARLTAGAIAAIALLAVVGGLLTLGSSRDRVPAAPVPPTTPPVAAASPLVAPPAPEVPAPRAPAPDPPPLTDDPLDGLLALAPAPATNGYALAALLDAWRLPSDEPGRPSFAQLLATLEERGLRLLRIGSLEEALRLDLPTLVQIEDPEGATRAVLVRHVEGDRVQLEGLLPEGPVRIPRGELLQRWNGTGYVAWRDFEGLPPVLRTGQSGDAVRFAQQALASLGHYLGDTHGSYDDATERAVAAFQRSNGLTPDGDLGPRTQVRLYHALPDYRMPLLVLSPSGRAAAR